ncbi:MAG: SAM-dependent methyltransferase [Acidimicrobiales bacterium]|nr:SAM-dependent methyltransferase [Acidimicrobiales bacterium]
MTLSLQPIGYVRGGRTEAIDDNWGDVEAVIELDASDFDADVTAGLAEFSHLDVVYVFHLVDESKIETKARHPRNNPDWPLVGIFAQRAKGRPNRIGVTTCEIVKVDGLRVHVRGLDAIDGTPVVDLKPYMTEFAPRSAIRQPQWATDLMTGYLG